MSHEITVGLLTDDWCRSVKVELVRRGSLDTDRLAPTASCVADSGDQQ